MDDASSALIIELPASPERPRRRGGRHLKAVTAPRRRRSTAVPVLVGAAVVFVGMFLIAGMHAFLIDGQIELDALQREVASESEAVERLRLEVAELEAPDRVLQVARDRLGMQEPPEIGYVLPDGGATADLLRVTPATVPPPPPPPTTIPPATVDGAESDGAPTRSAEIDDAVAAALASAGIDPITVPADADPADAPTTGASTSETERTSSATVPDATATTPDASATTGAGE